MSKPDLSRRTALVTGASNGLGVDFADQLAARGADLVLVARRADALEQVAQTLRQRHGVQVRCIASDLAEPRAPERLFERLREDGVAIDILVNNAGFGLHGRFLDIPWERERAMLELDILAVVHLTKLFLPAMVERGFGHVLQVASIGAYQASPSYASYSAAKRFVLDFGEALNYELKGSGVSCTVVSPGVTRTAFLDVAGQRPTLYQRLIMMRSADVARIGIDRMLRRRASVVTGWRNLLTAWFSKLAPRRISTALTARLMR